MNTIEAITHTLNLLMDAISTHLYFMLLCLALLWGIQLVNWLVGYRLNVLGIHPRKWYGIIGIPLSPLLHGNANHLFFNSIPFFVLANLVLTYGMHKFYCVTINTTLISGVLIWLFARSAIHIGASALIMGYLGYLMIMAYHTPSVMTVVIGFVALYYFGGLLLGLLPQGGRVSWEGHIFGFIGGLVSGYDCPNILSRLF